MQWAFARKCEPLAFTSGIAGPHTRRVKSSDGTNVLAPLAIPLAELARGETGLVTGLSAVAGLTGDHADTLITRLRDLGFVAGARCEVIARMWPSGDPLAVRIGGSTFALRRVEADAVRVTRLISEPASQLPLAAKDNSAVAA